MSDRLLFSDRRAGRAPSADPSTRNDGSALTGFEAIKGRQSRIMVRRGYEMYAPLFAPAGASVARRVAVAMVQGGRRAHPIILLPSRERVVVRTYLRGGLLSHLNRRYYFRGHRAFEELQAIVRADAGGVHVPKVVMAAEHRRAICYTATLATHWIEGAVDGAAWLRSVGAVERKVMLREAGRQIARMHAAGVAHRDLNLRNLLVVERPGLDGPMVYLIDFDRAQLSEGPTPPRRRARDLRRLGRSARKLGLSLESDAGWLALRLGYGTDWPLRSLGYRASARSTFPTT